MESQLRLINKVVKIFWKLLNFGVEQIFIKFCSITKSNATKTENILTKISSMRCLQRWTKECEKVRKKKKFIQKNLRIQKKYDLTKM